MPTVADTKINTLQSTVSDPWSNPGAWDTLVIGPVTWYGKFEIRGAARKYNWNIGTGFGFVGAYEAFQSQPPVEFSITIFVWAHEQYDQFLQLLGLLLYTPLHYPQPPQLAGGNVVSAAANLNDAIKANNAAPSQNNSQIVLQAQAALKAAQANPTKSTTSTNAQALQIVHPQLLNNNITQVVVKSVGGLEKQSDDLMFSFTIELLEFFPQRPMQPQSPDTPATDDNIALKDPLIRDLTEKGNVSQQRFSDTISGMGQPNGMPK